ncbi:tyrosine-type recombinase/integrase [Haloarcula japonica]|uniref:tyrosine-type recombinase/integrase n=1 Tax=Haloarcula japonica TaxID=29282 RepID=UPI0039F72949
MIAPTPPNDDDEQPDEQQFDVPSPHARKYLHDQASVVLSESTLGKRKCELRLFVEFLHKQRGTTILDADKADVEAFLKAYARKGNRQETLRNKLSAVRELYKYTHTHSDADELVLEPYALDDMGRKIEKYNTPESMKREGLDEDEFEQLVEAAKFRRDQLMILVAYETAARNKELRLLKLDDVDLEDNKVRFRRTKGSKSIEKPITERLAFEIEQWIEVDRAAWPTAEESDYLFPADKSEKLKTNEGFNNIIKEAASRAGIQEIKDESTLTERQQETMDAEGDTREWRRVTAHVLRHTHVKHFHDELEDDVLRENLGHESFSTTEEYYLPDEDHAETIRDAMSDSWDLD